MGFGHPLTFERSPAPPPEPIFIVLVSKFLKWGHFLNPDLELRLPERTDLHRVVFDSKKISGP